MTETEHTTTRALIDRVNSQNRRFRIASVIFGIASVLGLIVLLILALSTLQGVNRQLAQQKTLLDSQQQILNKIAASSKQRTAQINDLQKHIDCIVELFQQPNRANLTITDLQDCRISANGQVSSDQTNSSGASAPAQSAPAKTSTPSTGASDEKPTPQQSTLDRIPVLGRVFKKLGL